MRLFRIQNLLICSIIFGFLFSSTAFASDTEYMYAWDKADGIGDVFHPILPEAVEDDAGVFERVEFSFDSATNLLTVEVEFSTNPAGRCESVDYGPRIPTLLSLVLSNGKMPDGIGEFAAFYLDYTAGTPILTVYNYNGNMSSWDSESYLGNDKICTSLNPATCVGWLQNLSVTDDLSGNRIFSFTVDTTSIINFPITETSPFALPWLGAQFEELVGYWMFSYAYPNMSITYTPGGYIADVDFGMNDNTGEPQCGDQCYSGFFDGKYKETERDSFCEGASGSYTVNVGELFETTFQATNPDNEEITVTYTGIPIGALVTPADGTTELGQLDGTFTWTPSEDQGGQTYPIGINFIDEDGLEIACPFEIIVPEGEVDCLGVPGGDAEYDRCGVCDGDGMSCIDCEDFDVENILLGLDGVADAQANIVKKLTRTYKKAAKGTSQEKSAKKFRKKTNLRADELFTENWTFTWSTPTIVTQCAESEFCVEVSNVASIEQYNVNSDELFQLAKQTKRKIKKITKLKKKVRKLVKEAKALNAESFALSTTVPTSQSVCN